MARDFGHQNLPLAGIKVCYCLTDFTRTESGMTLMARGTHLHAEPLRIPKGAVDPLGVEVKDLQLNAGDALFFENRIFHTAAPNRSDRTSKVVIYGYAYRWLRPKSAMQLESLFDQVDPIRRQLLGYATSANGYFDPQPEDVPLRDWMRDSLGYDDV